MSSLFKVSEATQCLVQDGYNAGNEFSYLLSKVEKPDSATAMPTSVSYGGRPAVLLPASAGVSDVPTPVVNPPLPYSLLAAQAGRPPAQVCYCAHLHMS